MTYDNVLSTLKNKAATQVAAYPQYAGEFDTGWGVATALLTFRTKFGVCMTAGESVMVEVDADGGLMPRKAGEYSRWPEKLYVSIWSMRNRIKTSVPLATIDLRR